MTEEEPAGTAATVPDPAVARPAGGALPPPAVFAILFTVLVASIAGSVLLLAGLGRFTPVEPAPVAITPAPATAAPGQTSSARVRVLSAGGDSTPTDGDTHQVTFTWTLEGAEENDPVEVHFYVGNQLVGREQGSLDASVFSFSSGLLTLVTEQQCSPSGWSADLVTIRGALVDGDGIAQVPGVACE
ncbi:MAG: hypothetical protein ACRDGT_07000 [Candidatus Limnocylindria bacterium]